MTQITYGSRVALTVTNLQSNASSATAGWQSDVIDNRSTRAIDYLFEFKFPMANTAPANERGIFVYAVPASHDGSAWVFADAGTTTMPSGSESDYTIAGVTTTNNLIPLATLAYTTQNQVVQGWAAMSNAVGQSMPQGFSLIVVNYTGAALSTGCVIAYVPVT
jgi:hypothetical protein